MPGWLRHYGEWRNAIRSGGYRLAEGFLRGRGWRLNLKRVHLYVVSIIWTLSFSTYGGILVLWVDVMRSSFDSTTAFFVSLFSP